MLPDDQMIEAAWASKPAHSLTMTSDARVILTDAFAALDRDALIDQAADALRSTGIEHGLRERAEVVLRAVGLIP